MGGTVPWVWVLAVLIEKVSRALMRMHYSTALCSGLQMGCDSSGPVRSCCPDAPAMMEGCTLSGSQKKFAFVGRFITVTGNRTKTEDLKVERGSMGIKEE